MTAPRLPLALAVLFLLSTSPVSRADTIGSYEGCKKLSGGTKASCNKCLQGGNFFNKDPKTKKWVCGMTSDMKVSKPVKAAPPPKKPALSKYYSEYATVQPGTSIMGSRESEPGRNDDETRTTVKVTRAFLVKTTEVTHGEWYNVMGTHHWNYSAECGWDCPVAEVRWTEAIEYLNKLSKREKLEPCYDLDGEVPVWTKGLDCKGYRLPTEAEWVLAARGGTDDARYGDLDAIAWYSGNSDSKVHPVGQKQANAFGLYDMIGNLNEWVWDVWNYKTPDKGAVDPIRSSLPDGTEATAGTDRTMCGGDFYYGDYRARAAARQAQPASASSSTLGFRPVRTK